MTLWSYVRPALPSGAYTMTVSEQISGASVALPVPDATRSFRVTGPRYAMPTNEVFSVFPPPNASGDFSTRLPQIVLKRRTLPWERSAVGAPPWLALVVLADAEAHFLPAQPIAQAVTPGVTLPPEAEDGSTCDVLEVTETVVNQIFPTEEDMNLLCHVRQVDVNDTEFCGNDEDGWLAVVLSNRLPQPGVRYAAYLISLEGQFHELPDSAQLASVKEIGSLRVYNLSNEVIDIARASAAGTLVTGAVSPDVLTHAMPKATGSTREGRIAGVAPSASASVRDSWNELAVDMRGSEDFIASATGERSRPGFVIHDIDLAWIDPPARRLRFPVLAHWSFQCTDGGDFQSLMENLDVGLLGTVRTAREPGEPPPPVVTGTGHAAIDRLSRRGEQGQVWYRSPFTPREIVRRSTSGAGSTPVFHVAEQAVRVGEDGREDISEAAAFEVGRLLALGSPDVIAGLREWRRDDFGRNRLGGVLSRVPVLEGIRAFDRSIADLAMAAMIDRFVIDERVLGPVRLIDTLPDPPPMMRGDPATLIADGLGLEHEMVRNVLSTEATTAGFTPDVLNVASETRFDSILRNTEDLGTLSLGLDRTVEGLHVEIESIGIPHARRKRVPHGEEGSVFDDVFGAAAPSPVRRRGKAAAKRKSTAAKRKSTTAKRASKSTTAKRASKSTAKKAKKSTAKKAKKRGTR
jgi:hypothetical protein